MQKKIEVHGTILRNCEHCKKPRECLCFVVDGKNHTMCDECIQEQYGLKKKEKQLNKISNEFCRACQGMTMTRNPDNDIVERNYIIHQYVCEKCGRKKNHKINKWRR